MKRILVTGATGFIGQALCRYLAARGFAVRAASRAKRQDSPGIEYVEIPDLGKAHNWSSLLTGIDAVVHSAAIAHTSGIDEATYDIVNHRAVVELARAAQGKVERLVFLSSIRAQCGNTAPHTLSEQDDARPSDAYGRAKLKAENSLLEMKADVVILRPVLVVGSGPSGNLSTMVRLARLPLPLPFGSLAAERSLVARTDLCAAVEHVLDERRHIRETYIVAHPEAITIADMFAALRRGLDRPPWLVDIPTGPLQRAAQAMGFSNFADRLFGGLVASPTKLAGTGWKPLVNPRAALAEIGAPYRNEGPWS